MPKPRKRIVGETGINASRAKFSGVNIDNVVPINAESEVYHKKSGTIVIRGRSRGGGLNDQAKAIQDCKGKKGRDFAICLVGAQGDDYSKIPKAMTRKYFPEEWKKIQAAKK